MVSAVAEGLVIVVAVAVVKMPVVAVAAPMVVPFIVPPVMAAPEEPKLLAVTNPAVETVMAVVSPLLPTLKRILSVVPTPEVDCNVKVDDAVVPP